jgi:hypothetical protein
MDAIAGRAAIERVDEQEEVSFRDGEIVAHQQPAKIGHYTEFVVVPGSFVVVENGTGTFAFDLISEQTGAEIERAELDLYELSGQIEGADPWQIGFYNNSGRAEKGTVYGDNLLTDDEIGEVLKRAEKNQLGLRFNGRHSETVQMTATESGYLEIYQPDSYDTEEFLQFISDYILPSVSNKDSKP